jgi:hypothetical protein
MASIKMADGCRYVANSRGILCALVGSSRFLVSLWRYSDASSAEGDDGGRHQTKNWNRRDVLAASGRGTIEQDTMPVSGDRVSLAQHARRGSDLDKEDPRDEQHKRHYRVHHDAELAMIGVTPNRMHMRYLGDG